MRIALAMTVFLIIAVVLGGYLDLLVTAAGSAQQASPQWGVAYLGLFAATCGGFISRRRYFVFIAIAVYSIFWALAIHHLHAFPGDRAYAGLMASNARAIAISLFSVVVGAFLGWHLSRIGKRRSVVA
jgi:hypothetical protein